MDCSLPGSSIHGIFQARVLEWGAIAFSEMSQYMWKYILHSESSVSHSVVSDSLRPHGLYSLTGSSVHGILQARILEWVAISSSWEIFLFQGSKSILLYYRQILYYVSHQGSPYVTIPGTCSKCWTKGNSSFISYLMCEGSDVIHSAKRCKGVLGVNRG